MLVADRDERLVARELRERLEACQIRTKLEVVQEASSTNDLAWEAEALGRPERFVVFAERQTKGRGQYGRGWESAPYRGLWFSVLLRPKMTLAESPQLTSLLSGMIASAIQEQIGCVPQVKPPNDIFLSARKVAGVLVEGRTRPDRTYVAVAGIGINVNQTIDDFPEELRLTAGSLAMATGRVISRIPLAVAILRKVFESRVVS